METNGTILEVRKLIWSVSKSDTAIIEKAKQGIKLDTASVMYWEAVLRRVEELVKPVKRKVKKVDPTTQESKDRYRAAKYNYELQKFPAWINDGHFLEPDYPNCGESNGLTDWVMSYIKWKGGRSTRVSSAGRQVEGKWIPGTTRKGSSDVSSTINGKSVMWEIKAGKDTPSPAQLKEQAKERAAGGEYFFVHSAEEFFVQWDSLNNNA